MNCVKNGCEARVDYKVVSKWGSPEDKEVIKIPNGIQFKGPVEGEFDPRYCCGAHLDDAMEFDNTMIVTSVHPTIIGNLKGMIASLRGDSNES